MSRLCIPRESLSELEIPSPPPKSLFPPPISNPKSSEHHPIGMRVSEKVRGSVMVEGGVVAAPPPRRRGRKGGRREGSVEIEGKSSHLSLSSTREVESDKEEKRAGQLHQVFVAGSPPPLNPEGRKGEWGDGGGGAHSSAKQNHTILFSFFSVGSSFLCRGYGLRVVVHRP